MSKSLKRQLLSPYLPFKAAHVSSSKNTFFTIWKWLVRSKNPVGPFLQLLSPTGDFMRTNSLFSFFVFLSLIISDAAEARMFGRRASDFKGFNPCGWNTCQPVRSGRVGPIRRLFGGGRMVGSCGSGACGPRRGSCGSGSCGPRQGFGGGQPGVPSQQGDHVGGQGGPSERPIPRQRPVQDGDEVPAPNLDQQAATQEEDEEGLTEEQKAGKKIFVQNCRGCHTEEKVGVIKALKDWKKEEWERAIEAVKDGSMPKSKPRSIKGKELEDIIAYFKSQIAKEKDDEAPAPNLDETASKPEQPTSVPKELELFDPNQGLGSPKREVGEIKEQAQQQAAATQGELELFDPNEPTGVAQSLDQQNREGLVKLQSNILRPKRMLGKVTSPAPSAPAQEGGTAGAIDVLINREMRRVTEEQIRQLDSLNRFQEKKTEEVKPYQSPTMTLPFQAGVDPFGASPFRGLVPDLSRQPEKPVDLKQFKIKRPGAN